MLLIANAFIDKDESRQSNRNSIVLGIQQIKCFVYCFEQQKSYVWRSYCKAYASDIPLSLSRTRQQHN